MKIADEIRQAVDNLGINTPITNPAEVAAAIKEHGQGVARLAGGKEVLIRRQMVAQAVN